MKTTEKDTKLKPGSLKHAGNHQQLKTDSPLSEKDEVKDAESKMRKARKGIL